MKKKNIVSKEKTGITRLFELAGPKRHVRNQRVKFAGLVLGRMTILPSPLIRLGLLPE